MDLNREALLKKLKSIEVMAKPVVVTDDMGIEFLAASAKGAVESPLGLYGDWPAYGPILFNSKELNSLYQAILQKKFKPKLFEGMEFESFMSEIMICFYYHGTDKKKQRNFLEKFIKRILDLQLRSKDEFYFYFDKFGGDEDLPLLFKSEKELAEYFMSLQELIPGFESWDDMDTGDLEYWSDLLDDYDNLEPITVENEFWLNSVTMSRNVSYEDYY